MDDEPRIPEPAVPAAEEGKALALEESPKPTESETVQINLKYWYARCECWSDWRLSKGDHGLAFARPAPP